MSIGIGDRLREARESQGRTQQDAAQVLLVRTDYIEALETEQFGVFGADTYARGHLRNYANALGLDPQPLLDIYDRYVRTDDQTAHHMADAPVAITTRDPLPRWITVIGAVVAFLGAIALIGVVGGRTPEPADGSIADERTDVSPSPDAAPVRPTPTPEPEPRPTFDGVEMLLVAEADCWLRIWVDDQPPTERTLRAGEELELQASETIRVLYGNAGGVIVEVNGTSYGRPGGNGAVVSVDYGPDGPTGDEAAA